jgi:hypothetical protein
MNGGCAVVVEALKLHPQSPDVLVPCCKLLANLSKSSRAFGPCAFAHSLPLTHAPHCAEGVRAAVLRSGSVQLLLAVMTSHASDAQVAKWACYALNCVAETGGIARTRACTQFGLVRQSHTCARAQRTTGTQSAWRVVAQRSPECSTCSPPAARRALRRSRPTTRWAWRPASTSPSTP